LGNTLKIMVSQLSIIFQSFLSKSWYILQKLFEQLIREHQSSTEHFSNRLQKLRSPNRNSNVAITTLEFSDERCGTGAQAACSSLSSAAQRLSISSGQHRGDKPAAPVGIGLHQHGTLLADADHAVLHVDRSEPHDLQPVHVHMLHVHQRQVGVPYTRTSLGSRHRGGLVDQALGQ
jgi:hypothetical protein